MADEFDPYYEWLGIPPQDQPPNHYRLLGLQPGESNPQVIANAAQRQAVFVGTFESGPQSEHVPRLLQQIAAARICLLSPAAKSAYDARLRLRPRHRPWAAFFGSRSATEESAATSGDEHDSSPAWLLPAVIVGGTTLFVLVLVTLVAIWVSTRSRSAEALFADSGIADDVELATSPTHPELAVVPSQEAPRKPPGSGGPDAAAAAEPILAADGPSNRPRPANAGTSSSAAGSASPRPVGEAISAPSAASEVRPAASSVPSATDAEAERAVDRAVVPTGRPGTGRRPAVRLARPGACAGCRGRGSAVVLVRDCGPGAPVRHGHGGADRRDFEKAGRVGHPPGGTSGGRSSGRFVRGTRRDRGRHGAGGKSVPRGAGSVATTARRISGRHDSASSGGIDASPSRTCARPGGGRLVRRRHNPGRDRRLPSYCDRILGTPTRT